MLLWASAQAVPASVEKSSGSSPPCNFSEDAIAHKRMTHRSDVIGAHSNVDSDDNHEPTVVKSSKNLHERQVRTFEHVNKLAKNKYPHDKNTFVSYESAKSSFDFIRNISSLDDKIMNNGESVSVESISEATLATFKESDVKTNAEKETSDKIYLHVNGESASRWFFSVAHLPQVSLVCEEQRLGSTRLDGLPRHVMCLAEVVESTRPGDELQVASRRSLASRGR